MNWEYVVWFLFGCVAGWCVAYGMLLQFLDKIARTFLEVEEKRRQQEGMKETPTTAPSNYNARQRRRDMWGNED